MAVLSTLLLSKPMRGFRLLLLALLAFTVAAATPKSVESTHLKIIVGVTDDTAKWMSRQDGIVGVHRDLRLMAVRVTVPWKPGQVRPTKLQQVYLHRIARMIQLNDRIVLAVYNVARYAPTDARERNQYCAFLHGVVRRLPLIHDVEIWNEANSPAYWPQDAGAAAYAALLARCYDVLHSRPGPINVKHSCATRSCSRTASRQSPASSTSAWSTRTDSEAGRPASSRETGHANPPTTPSSRRSPRSASGISTAARSAARPQTERTWYRLWYRSLSTLCSPGGTGSASGSERSAIR